jgi:hypothetical protein
MLDDQHAHLTTVSQNGSPMVRLGKHDMSLHSNDFSSDPAGRWSEHERQRQFLRLFHSFPLFDEHKLKGINTSTGISK